MLSGRFRLGWQYDSVAGMEQLLASGRAGSHICFVHQLTSTVFSDSLTLFVFDEHKGFSILQSRVHELWARFFGSSLKDDCRYIPEDCFETFPFPPDFSESASLETAGKAYYVGSRDTTTSFRFITLSPRQGSSRLISFRFVIDHPK